MVLGGLLLRCPRLLGGSFFSCGFGGVFNICFNVSLNFFSSVSAMTTFPTQNDITFFASIGRLAVAWAHLEAGLDMMVDITHRLGGKEIERERPRSLKRKLKYFRQFFSSLPIEEDGKRPYARLFKEIGAQSDFRHDIIHGVIVENAVDSGEATLVGFLHEQDGLGRKSINVDTKTIVDAARQAESLGNMTLGWANNCLDGLPELARSISEQTQ